MQKKRKIAFYLLLILGVLLVVGLVLLLCMQSGQIAMLNPKGMIAAKQRGLLIMASWLMLIVVIPVFIMTVVFARKYRASNRESKYRPDWDQSLSAEIVWFGVPFVIIAVLSVLVWRSSHHLDPFRPIDTGVQPLTIQVVALQWKWLFIYPEQGIATVNFVQFPEKTPINFHITSDAPMNSFWIPQLGGQIYAMAGMDTQLHLIADEEGEFRGSSSNLSGKGFAGMRFKAIAVSDAAFEAWVDEVRGEGEMLDLETYQELAEPSEDNPPAVYRLGKNDLYDWIVMKYKMPM